MQDAPQASANHSTAESRQALRNQALIDVFNENFASKFQSPVVFLDDQILSSASCIRFYNKDFAYLSRQLYLEYQYRSWKDFNKEVLDRYSELVNKKLESIQTLLRNTTERLTKLLSQNGIQMETSLYPNPSQLTVPVIASQARMFFNLLLDLDRVNHLAGTANLWGVIDSTQRADAEFICKKAVRAFRSIMLTEAPKIYREGARVLAEQNKTGKVDTKMEKIIEEHGKELNSLDDNDESGSDAGMSLNGSDPSQFIDDAAAASIAASKAKRPGARAAANAATA